MNQIMVKQLKNRYNDPTVNKRFILGIDRAKMRLYDCEQSAQMDIIDANQEEETEVNRFAFSKAESTKNKFSQLKV